VDEKRQLCGRWGEAFFDKEEAVELMSEVSKLPKKYRQQASG
jgi:hypothetical protein